MFYTYVGDLQSVADAVELHLSTVDVVFHYWILKRKVALLCLFFYIICLLPSVL